MQQRSASTDDPAPEQRGSAGPPGFHGDQNFAERLPWEVSQDIFSRLDARSLCSASLTCSTWRSIIEDSDRLWRTSCLQLRSVCSREVDRDRGDGLSWKVSSEHPLGDCKVSSEHPLGGCKVSSEHPLGDCKVSSEHPLGDCKVSSEHDESCIGSVVRRTQQDAIQTRSADSLCCPPEVTTLRRSGGHGVRDN